MFRDILVPYDGSAASATALRLAVDMTRAGNGVLTVLVADEPVVDWMGSAYAAPGAAAGLFAARTAEAGERLAVAGAHIPDGTPNRLVLAHGRPTDVILAELATGHHDVVIMGNRGHGDAGALVLGSVSHDVVRRSPVPVVVVREDMQTAAADTAADVVIERFPAPYELRGRGRAHNRAAARTETSLGKRPILLATDGSSIAARARVIAVDLCLRSGAPLHIVHGWGLSGSFKVATLKTPSQLKKELQADASRLVANEASVAAADGVPGARGHAVHDGPGASILLAAQTLNPALIVIGNRGRGALRRAVLGTVSEVVVSGASHPVLVIHEDSSWPPTRVVVGDDGSDEAHQASALAAQLARMLGADVVLVHGRRGQVADMEGVPAPEWLAERATLLEASEGCPVTSRVLDDDAIGAVTRVAASAPSLVVLGVHRRPSSQLTSRGTISTALLRHLHHPLVVVPWPHSAWTSAAVPQLDETGDVADLLDATADQVVRLRG